MFFYLFNIYNSFFNDIRLNICKTSIIPIKSAIKAIIGVAHNIYSKPNILRIIKNNRISNDPLCTNESKNGLNPSPVA